MTLYCFDVDGTLLTDKMYNEGQYVKGIIPTSSLKQLEAKGHTIAIVSPSPYLPIEYEGDDHWFNRNGSNDYRWENIQDAMKHYKVEKEDVRYVDDLDSNVKQIEKWGVITYSPEEFLSAHLPVILKRCQHNIPYDDECTACHKRDDLLLD